LFVGVVGFKVFFTSFGDFGVIAAGRRSVEGRKKWMGYIGGFVDVREVQEKAEVLGFV
jgi:hypothetical protein